MKWRVTAWVMSPGDFPQRLLKHRVVEARTISDAVAKAENSLLFESDAITVQATRIQPPVDQETP